MPYLETIDIAFYNVALLNKIFFIRSLQMSDSLHRSSFFLHYLTLFYDGDQLQ